jgi:hypothetical protein
MKNEMKHRFWLKGQTSKGMFPGEIIFTVEAFEASISLFIQDGYTQFNFETEELEVSLIEYTTNYTSIRLPYESLEGYRVIRVYPRMIRKEFNKKSKYISFYDVFKGGL